MLTLKNNPTITIHQLKFVRKPEVLNRFPVSNSTLYYRINQGLFPPPISLGGRATAWLEHEIDVVLEAIISGSNTNQIKSLVNSLIEQRQIKIGEYS